MARYLRSRVSWLRAWPHSSVVTIAAASLFAAALALLLWRLINQSLFSMDFRYIWLAGKLWSGGQNPYSAEYASAGAKFFPTGYPVNNWVYPFHWYWFATLLAKLNPERAFALYVCLTTISFFAAFFIMGTAAKQLGAKYSITATLLVAMVICSATPLTSVLSFGQPAAAAEIGLALLLFGVTRKRSAVTALGVALALLKPHIGIPAVAAILFLPGAFRAIIAGGALVFLGSIPALWDFGLIPQVIALLGNSSGEYQMVTVNSPAYMSGMGHWIHLVGWGELSISVSLAVATIIAFAGAIYARRWPMNHRTLFAIGSSITLTAAIVQLHSHDLAILFFGLPFLALMSTMQRVSATIGYLLIWRPENIGRLVGQELLAPTLQSLAALLILAAWVGLVFSVHQDDPAASGVDPNLVECG